MSETDLIDLNKRTQKELLIELYQDVKVLKNGMETLRDRQSKQDVVIATIKTQLRSWAIVWGAVSGIIVSLISKFM